MFKNKIFLPIIILVLVLSITACSTDKIDENPADTSTPVEENKDTNVSGDEYADIKIKPEEAFDIYMEKYPNTKVKKVEMDKEMGKFVYKIEGFNENKEYELKIDSKDGSIIKEHVETDDDMDDLEITRIHVEKVMVIVDKVIAEAGEDTKLEEWTLDIDNGKAQLEIEIDKKGFDNEEHTYDIESGELIEIDR